MFHDDLDDEVSTFFNETRRQTASRHRRHATTDSSTSSVLRTRRETEVGDINTKLAVISERLKAESTRANIAEHRALDYSHRLHSAAEELKLYKLRFKEARTRTSKAQDTISQVVAQRNDAEVESARAITLARKLREEKLVMLAREEGRKSGYKEGLFKGRGFSQQDDDFYFNRDGGGGRSSRNSARNGQEARRRSDGREAENRAAERSSAYLVNGYLPRPTLPRMATPPSYFEAPRRPPAIIPPAPYPLVVSSPRWSPVHVPSLPPPPISHRPRRFPRRSTRSVPEINVMSTPESPTSFSASSELLNANVPGQPPLSQDVPSRAQDLRSQPQPRPRHEIHHSPSSLTRAQPGSPWPPNFMPFLSSPTAVPESRLMTNPDAATSLDGNARLPQDEYEHRLSPPSIPVNEAVLLPSGTGSSSPSVRANTPRRGRSEDGNSEGRRSRGRDHNLDGHWNRHEIETVLEVGADSRRGLATESMEIGGETSGNVDRTGTRPSADLQDELLPRLESLQLEE